MTLPSWEEIEEKYITTLPSWEEIQAQGIKVKEKEKPKIGISPTGNVAASMTNLKPKEPKEKKEEIIPIPKLEDIQEIKITENNLNAMDKTYTKLDESITNDYQQLKDYANQLDKLEIEIQEAPQELVWNLQQKHEILSNLHNNLVDKLKADTEKQRILYQNYINTRDKYEQDIVSLDKITTIPQYSTEDIVRQLKGYETTKDPTWGTVITQSLKAGLGQYQASLFNVLRLIQTGAVKLTDKITDVFDEDWYDPNKDFILNALTQIVEDSEKIAAESSEQTEAKNWLKKFIGTGLQSTPQIIGSVIMGAGMPVVKGNEFFTRLSQMTPFGISGGGGHAREIEKEYEALGKEAPYAAQVIGGILGGAGEMATELPVFIGVTRLLSDTGKRYVNEGAKNLISKYGRVGIEWLKNALLQAGQEAEMEPISMAINQAMGLPQDWSKLPVRMKDAAYGGLAMATVLGGLGGAGMGVARLATNQAIEQNKSFKETKEAIQEATKPLEYDKQAIELKIDEVVNKELPRIVAQFPDITLPEIQEKIMPEVEQEIKKIVPKTETKIPEITIPKEIISTKVKETIEKVLPKHKIEPKLAEVKIPTKPDIEHQIDEIVKRELPKLGISLVDIDLSKYREEIIPKVGDTIEDFTLNLRKKMKEQTKITEFDANKLINELNVKIDKVVTEEVKKLSEHRIEGKFPEVKIPEEEVKPETIEVEPSAESLIKTAKKDFPLLSDKDVLDTAKTISYKNGSEKIKPFEMSEALSLEIGKLEDTINEITLPDLFTKKGKTEIFQRIEELGLSDKYLDKEFVSLVNKIKTNLAKFNNEQIKTIKDALNREGNFPEKIKKNNLKIIDNFISDLETGEQFYNSYITSTHDNLLTPSQKLEGEISVKITDLQNKANKEFEKAIKGKTEEEIKTIRNTLLKKYQPELDKLYKEQSELIEKGTKELAERGAMISEVIKPTPELTTEKKAEVKPKPEKKIELPEIPPLTKNERMIIENTSKYEDEYFIYQPSHSQEANKALQKLIEKGYIDKDNPTVLTEKGIELYNIIHNRIEAEKAGISLEQREKTKVVTDKQMAPEGFFTGKVNGEDFYTNGYIMLKGKPELIDTRSKPNMQQLADMYKDVHHVEPILYADERTTFSKPMIVFDNGAKVQAQYYDYILDKFPNAEFRGTNNPLESISIYSNNEFVGMVAGMRDVELPSNFPQLKKAPIEEVEEEGEAIERPEEQGLFEEGVPLQAKTWGEELAIEPETEKKINKTEIMTWIEKAFNIPIKGVATFRWRKAAGKYYPQQQIIRMEKWGELAVATHELAHSLDYKVFRKELGSKWRTPPKAVAIRKELADLDYKQGKSGRRTSEGFAEYMRYRLTTDKAKQVAPNFHKYFNEEVLSKFPDIKKNLNQLKEMLDTWNKQGAETRVIQQVDWKGEHQHIKGIMPKLRKALEWINTNFNDEFYYAQKSTKAIEKELGKELRPTMNPAKMMQYSKASSGAIARTFVMQKAINEEGMPIGPGLIDILRPIPRKEMQSFISYAISKRAINLNKRGIESGFDLDDANYIVNKYKDKGWDDTVDEVTKWSNYALDWLVNAGALDKETAKLFRDLNPVYLPFKRAFLDEIAVYRGTGGYVDTGKGIKAIKGSGRPIINPFESMVTQMRELINKAQKIRIAKIWADLSEEEGLGGFVTRVPAPMKATTFSANQIRDYLNEIVKQAKTEERELLGKEEVKGGFSLSQEQYDDFLTVFTQDWQYRGKENIVSIWKNGERQFYEIHPDLYEALKGVDPLKLGPFGKVCAPFSKMIRLGATGLKFSFGFGKNPFRDAFTYVDYSLKNNATVFDPAIGVYKDLTCKPGELAWRFKALGGGISGQIGFDRASVQNTYDEMLDLRLGAVGKGLYMVKHPVTALQDIISVTEKGPRIMELEASYKRYTSEEWKKTHPDWTEEDAWVQAYLDAKDVTIDFTKSGRIGKQINQVAAFYNVAIRGPEKLYRAFRDRPIQTIVKGIVWLTIPALANWYKNRDKDWYKNLPPAYKYNNLWFEIGNQVIRLPIPFELGMIFMSAVWAFIDTFQYKDDESLKGLLDMVKAQIPDPTPSMLKPLIEVKSNKNWLGLPIESPGMQYLYPSERKKEYTTKLAISLSKGADEIGIKISPIKIDYLLDGYTGGFSKQFRITGNQLADYPVIGDIILRDPGFPSKQLNEYFSDYELLSQKRASGIATREELTKYNKIIGFYDYYKTMQKAIKKAKEQNNTKLLNNYYKMMTDRLARYGYE